MLGSTPETKCEENSGTITSWLVTQNLLGVNKLLQDASSLGYPPFKSMQDVNHSKQQGIYSSFWIFLHIWNFFQIYVNHQNTAKQPHCLLPSLYSTISDDHHHHHRVFNCNLCSTFPVDFSNSIETKLEAPSMTHVNLVNKWEIKLKKGNGKCIPQHAYACSHMARTHVYWL